MKPEDRLILDGEIFDEAQSMARRDNPRVRRFLYSLLASVGIAEEDGEIRFNHKTDERHQGLHLITRYFRAERDLIRHRQRAAHPAAARRTHRPEFPISLYARSIRMAGARAGRDWRF